MGQTQICFANDHLEALYQVGSIRREKAINLFTKILTNIMTKPDEPKYQNLNYKKLENKFTQLQCKFMIDLLLSSGFVIEADRLVLVKEENRIEHVLQALNEKAKAEQDKLEQERLKIIEQNKQRLSTKSNLKKKPFETRFYHNTKSKWIWQRRGCIMSRHASLTEKERVEPSIHCFNLLIA